jgi:ATP-binding cassette subfamily G (WHITE) protein 2
MDDRTGLLNSGGPAVYGGATKPVTPFEDRTPVTLSWRDLVYEVPLKKEKTTKRILHGVSGHVSSGQMIALLGPSGAGKTTMLDILARRAKGGNVTGELLMNGHPIDDGVFRRVSAYVQQEDIMHGYLTVRETIRFNALLRLPSTVSDEEVDRKVLSIMQLLGIDHIADNKIGSDFARGISGGEKKRTAIALELVTSPSLLFLDEPTTGLDTFTALHLLTLLKNLAKTGTTVIFSIHQPRSSIFRLFDLVLVLNGYGEEAYFGPATDAVPFLQSAGVVTDQPDNPADFLLDSVSVVRAAENINREDFPDLPPPEQSKNISAAFRDRKMQQVNNEITEITARFVDGTGLPPALKSPYYRSVFQQIRIVSKRAFLNKMRDPIATLVAIVVAIIFALLVGSIYFRLNLQYPNIQNRLGVLFFFVMNTAFSNLGSLAIFLMERNIYVREHGNGMYRPSAYYLGKIVQDVPISLMVNLLFNVIGYFMCGLQASFDKFMKYFLVNSLVMLNSYTLCMWISNMSKNYQVANLIAPLLMVMFLIPSGMMINLNSLPVYWRWLKYISFVRFGYEAVVVNEFEGLDFQCTEVNAVCPTANSTVPGLAMVEAQMGFSADSFWPDVWACMGSMFIYLILGYTCLRFLQSKESK